MRISQSCHRLALWLLFSPVAVLQAQSPMGLGAAMQRAREVSPVRRSAQAEVTAARAAERQWACLRAIEPHLDWPTEQSLGTHVSLSHEAATPPGMTVTVRGTLTKVEGRKLTFEVEASDGVDVIARGTHERAVVLADRFRAAVAKKAAGAGVS